MNKYCKFYIDGKCSYPLLNPDPFEMKWKPCDEPITEFDRYLCEGNPECPITFYLKPRLYKLEANRKSECTP